MISVQKVLASTAALACLVPLHSAQAAPPAGAPAAAQTAPQFIVGTAAKTLWASGLRGPQGIARGADGNIYVAEYEGGQVARLSPDGKLLGHIGQGLKNPAWVARSGEMLYISERKANRVLRAGPDGSVVAIGPDVLEPLGLAVDARGQMLAVAHTTSQVLRLVRAPLTVVDNAVDTNIETFGWERIYTPPIPAGRERRYGYRGLAVDTDGSIFVSDEVSDRVLLITPAGRVTTFVADIDEPTGIALAANGDVFVGEEATGRVWQIPSRGEPIIHEGFGQPRGVLLLDESTLLVTDREAGNIWRVNLQ